MLILFDHGTPVPLQTFVTGHTVRHAKAQGWDTFKNGDLLIAAEAAGFDVSGMNCHPCDRNRRE